MPITKTQQRLHAYSVRNSQIDKDRLSAVICQQLIQQHAYQTASTVMVYLHCRSEVRTLAFVETQLKTDKKIIIPYCTKDENGNNQLGLWHLEDLTKLVEGTWGILEPPKRLWNNEIKHVEAKQLDLIIVPGVAFNCHGARLGNGAGYYDRLLATVREDCVLIGIAYHSQLFEKIQMNPYDIYMNFVLTEKQRYSR